MCEAHDKVNTTDLLLIGAIMLDVRHCYGRMQANVGGVAKTEWVDGKVFGKNICLKITLYDPTNLWTPLRAV